MQKLKNNEARPKFTGFHKKKRVALKYLSMVVTYTLFFIRTIL